MIRPKVFCIGWHKTGTTSIGEGLRKIGYGVGSWHAAVGDLVFKWHEGKLGPIKARAEKFEALEDLPWPLVYREMDEAFPGSRFILTLRRDEETWLRSYQKHVERSGRWLGHYLMYGSYDPVNDAEIHLTRYRAHNAAVRSYFADRPAQLLEMCFEDGDGWRELCDFLNVPALTVPFPHENKTAV